MEPTTPTPPISQSSAWQQFHGFAPWFFGLALLAGGARYFSLQHPVGFAFSYLGFIAGVALAHALFLEETQVKRFLGKSLKIPELETDRDSTLRHGLILLILPVLSFFALTSTRSPIGIGFIWSILAIYSYDLIQFLRTQQEHFVEPYFFALDASLMIQRALAAGFVVFALLFGVLFTLSRLVTL